MDRSIDTRDQEGPRSRRQVVEPSTEALEDLRNKVDSAIQGQPSVSELLDRLEAAGIRPVPSIQRSGRLNGMSYEWQGVRYRGSELGRAYTAKGLEKQGVQYAPERDDGPLRAAERRAKESPARSLHRTPDLRDRSLGAREYDALTESERSTMRQVGSFRTVLAKDFLAIEYGGERARFERDMAKLIAQKLVETRSVVIATHDRKRQSHTRSLYLIGLTKKGKELLKRFDPEIRQASQSLYAGFVKPREIAHDSAIYRMYQAEVAHIEKQGGRVKRVVLDFELKKQAYRPLAKARAISLEEFNRKRREIAEGFGLKVVEGKIRLPDLRIEYETARGDAARVDLELATEHYRAEHMAAKRGAGFKIYAESGSFPPGGSHGGSPVTDDHEIEIFSF
jgi:hypothetical protein